MERKMRRMMEKMERYSDKVKRDFFNSSLFSTISDRHLILSG